MVVMVTHLRCNFSLPHFQVVPHYKHHLVFARHMTKVIYHLLTLFGTLQCNGVSIMETTPTQLDHTVLFVLVVIARGDLRRLPARSTPISIPHPSPVVNAKVSCTDRVNSNITLDIGWPQSSTIIPHGSVTFIDYGKHVGNWKTLHL